MFLLIIGTIVLALIPTYLSANDLSETNTISCIVYSFFISNPDFKTNNYESHNPNILEHLGNLVIQ